MMWYCLLITREDYFWWGFDDVLEAAWLLHDVFVWWPTWVVWFWGVIMCDGVTIMDGMIADDTMSTAGIGLLLLLMLLWMLLLLLMLLWMVLLLMILWMILLCWWCYYYCWYYGEYSLMVEFCGGDGPRTCYGWGVVLHGVLSFSVATATTMNGTGEYYFCGWWYVPGWWCVCVMAHGHGTIGLGRDLGGYLLLSYYCWWCATTTTTITQWCGRCSYLMWVVMFDDG